MWDADVGGPEPPQQVNRRVALGVGVAALVAVLASAGMSEPVAAKRRKGRGRHKRNANESNAKSVGTGGKGGPGGKGGDVIVDLSGAR
jgi:hypothetical protein